ncbi:ABC transporter ATP-binding protein [Acidomonas methanolica]|uniref:ABC transporter n=3 Tax=Acidomonas methanolica TaxID=437 RepID=A0A023D5D8_ACIMT|nr:ATP-binding cassette domain-containing protein [Acidomonas methanolica]MBU2655623.1 ATP-binding cassette domain-containing protein [Acidomonas methanolica]TCS24428.1 peptide/nickel transport system ATP-binding protein [Acidomonas methanolica]BAN85815.1 probable peptide ABC transporter ATP-binding protein y4tS [Acidomonas methanolica]GAJ29274.1 ABC transporter [Acidomonas methanolica NBRC 104435]GEK99901.1 peptide ABC transporter ATP-binding protein [Acidomonas methanolica NBRC 104435]
MTDATPTLLTVEDLHVAYPAGPFWARRARPVVRGVSFDVREGEIVGLIGESGSGKSTIARAVAGLAPVTAGRIALTGRVQMIFQDPLSSLDPMMRVGAQIEEVLAIHRLAPRGGRRARAVELLERVGLSADLHGRLPAALSGGQRARVGIARALAAEPRLLIADEATAALDVSVQALVLNLLMDLRDDLGLAILFITHDLAVVRILCDRALVLHHGAVVEAGETAALFAAPSHDYTRALLAAHHPARRLHDRT